MSKLILTNAIGTLALAGILSAAHINPTLAASVNVPASDEETAKIMLVDYQIEQQAPGLFDAFLDLSPTERDRLIFLRSDARSMRMLAVANASKPTGPMDAR